MADDDLETAVQRLLAQVGHWETGRWAVGAGTGTRGDLVYALVQRLADHGAEAEQRPRRIVPREPDMILPDQLKVMTADLLAAGPTTELVDRALADVAETRVALSPPGPHS
ncbi:hypothetical protein [Actinoplanes sp. N902-109]|uniref:hypothetical protein n=1 Tax=Actinoplanes sp. (strain N902-109) TaxID=649831 RepID=UPI0003295B26|nr:hypothetical protein [Actinoplanes sp. N902-109]AGL14616.1 hypothetical protein L083_1106 [Actinoplanes sp. N902-109]